MRSESWWRKKYISLRSKFLKRYTQIPEEKRKSFYKVVESVLNYGLNAFFLSFPVSFFFYGSLWQPFPKVFLSLWALLPFLEHYYIWFREEWRDRLQNK